MSAGLLFDVPAAAVVSLAQLRQCVLVAQGRAVAALRAADDVSGEDNGADELAEDFLRADEVQRLLLNWLREWRARDDAGYNDEEEWDHPEGPLTADERKMMEVFQSANDRLNDLRMAIAAQRARELAELQEAGAVVSLGRAAR